MPPEIIFDSIFSVKKRKVELIKLNYSKRPAKAMMGINGEHDFDHARRRKNCLFPEGLKSSA
jgi:hypothetical protein